MNWVRAAARELGAVRQSDGVSEGSRAGRHTVVPSDRRHDLHALMSVTGITAS